MCTCETSPSSLNSALLVQTHHPNHIGEREGGREGRMEGWRERGREEGEKEREVCVWVRGWVGGWGLTTFTQLNTHESHNKFIQFLAHSVLCRFFAVLFPPLLPSFPFINDAMCPAGTGWLCGCDSIRFISSSRALRSAPTSTPCSFFCFLITFLR